MAKKKTIVVKDLQVKVTYTIGYGDIKMPKSIYKALLKTAEESGTIQMGGLDKDGLFSWLQDNTREEDCYKWEAEIEDISEHKV
jgi:hypothetical protein